jgi:DNA-binding transcriptional LysR family regulator
MAFAWDDLRLVLAVARGGTLAAAAASLAVNHSTVFRRLGALERDIGSKLFERLITGYTATEAGRRLIETAERMESEALALDRELTGRDTRLSGHLRVTCSETMGMKVLTPLIARFRKQYPGIVIDLMVDNRVIDMARREADVAIRATRPAQGDLFGRKIADIQWGLYASSA